METKMIIGIDHGNRNMKTANTVFSAAIQPLQARPDSLEHILEYQNQFYYVGGKVPEKECVDKTENENYYLLTLAALAQEMRFRGLTDASVKMGAALPPRRFQQQKESFKKYLLKTKELHFRYEGVHYHVSLENVFVFTMKNSFPVYEFSTLYGIIEKRLNWREPLFYKESANLVLF